MTNTKQQALSDNLSYCGFTASAIARYLELWEAGKSDAALQLLSSERAKLLDTIHAEQKKLDALDYLIFMNHRLEQEF